MFEKNYIVWKPQMQDREGEGKSPFEKNYIVWKLLKASSLRKALNFSLRRTI